VHRHKGRPQFQPQILGVVDRERLPLVIRDERIVGWCNFTSRRWTLREAQEVVVAELARLRLGGEP
jgi:hypothetical protein